MPASDAPSGAPSGLRDGRWVPLYDPAHDPVRALTDRYAREYQAVELLVWTVAIVLDIGDFMTTLIGVTTPGIVEGAPLSRWALRAFGWPGLLVEHVGALVALAGMWLALPRPYRLVVPSVAVWTGYVVTRANAATLLAAGAVDLPW